jgi:hypothetical protein
MAEFSYRENNILRRYNRPGLKLRGDIYSAKGVIIMKKVLLSFLISVLIISALSFGAGAEQYADTRDSRYIPPEDLAVINDPTAEIIVKAYNSDSISAFGYYENIEDALAYYCTPKWTVYIKKNAEGLSTYSYFTNKSGVTKLTKSNAIYVNHSSAALQELQTGEAISTVSPDIVIESVYFMYGSSNYDGNAIYYKTNLGDYVYYRGAWGGPEMLCTAERFYEYKRAEYEEIVANNTGEVKNGGGTSVEDWDLSAYDYRSPNFDPTAPLPNGNDAFPWLGLGAVVLSLAAVLVVYIIRRKKSMQEAEI